MRTKLFTIALMFISMNMSAQITVTDADLVDIGDVIYQATDSTPSSTITIGNAGANQTWDFSALQVLEYDTTEFIDPAGTPFASAHPLANLCFEDEGQLIYVEKSPNSLSVVGVDAFAYPFLLVPLPLVYGSTFTNPTTVVMDSVMPNMFFPDSIAPLLSVGQAHTIDSIRILLSVGSDIHVDAFGMVTIPIGAYDALRVKNDITTITSYSVYCTDTILNMNSGWFSASALIPNETDIQYSYQWWTNDVDIKFMLVQMDVDDIGNIEWVEFMHSPFPASIANLSSADYNIYPIPTTYNLTVEAENNELTILNLVDVNGKLIVNKQFNTSINLDLSQIAKGIYYLNLNTDEGKLTKKIIVE